MVKTGTSPSGAASHTEVWESTIIKCPICDKDMPSVAELNRHIDSNHLDTPASTESTNNSPIKQRSRRTTRENSPASLDTKGWLNIFSKDSDTTNNASSITLKTSHWQEVRRGAKCNHNECHRFVETQGIHCRQCGKLFCKKHLNRYKRLNRNAEPDYSSGQWYQVCTDCFESMPGYLDNTGLVRDKTLLFNNLRKPKVEQKTIIRDRMLRRLVKLISGIAKLDVAAGGFWAWKDVQKIRQFEQNEIVAWEDERPYERCRFCGQKFSYLMRKHHCRVCGLVVCGDLERECSREVALTIAAEKLGKSGMARGSTYPIRICVECRDTIFSKQTFAEEISGPLPQILQLTRQTKRIQQMIDDQLPIFEDAVAELLASPETTNAETLKSVMELRTNLLQSFRRYSNMIEKIDAYDAETDAERRIQTHIYSGSQQYLQSRMLSLQALPQVLRTGSRDSESRLSKDKLMALQNNLLILEEQKFLLQKQLDLAKNKRHFDSVTPLQVSIDDITSRIEEMRVSLGRAAPTN